MYFGQLVENNLSSNILDRWGIVSDDGAYNCCVKIAGYEKCMRGRSSMLVLRRNDDEYEVFLSFNNSEFNAPGGGWDKNETPMEAAIRECREEVRINVVDVKHMGTLIEYYEEAKQWVKDHVKNEKDWWYGYYSEIFVGKYDSDYTGAIKDLDKDPMIYEGKWYPVSEVTDKIPKEYASAIINYISLEEKKGDQ